MCGTLQPSQHWPDGDEERQAAEHVVDRDYGIAGGA
jgi:hypothetical protein